EQKADATLSWRRQKSVSDCGRGRAKPNSSSPSPFPPYSMLSSSHFLGHPLPLQHWERGAVLTGRLDIPARSLARDAAAHPRAFPVHLNGLFCFCSDCSFCLLDFFS